jgi:catechol 2,3-dioxygenase-like lactoylglutathione lyase family enzyme
VTAMTDVLFTAIDHVQLAMPAGGEETARRFYVDVLCMIELPKPRELAKRGGCWFQNGTVQVHLGVENDFRPAKKAHPAFRCSNYVTYVAHLHGAGIDVTEVDDIPGVRRCHIHDPFGNRIELIDA